MTVASRNHPFKIYYFAHIVRMCVIVPSSVIMNSSTSENSLA